MKSAKVAVLVGKSSNLKLELGTAVRATSVEEMLSLLSVCTNLEFAVIEKELNSTDQMTIDLVSEVKSRGLTCITYSEGLAKAFDLRLGANEDEIIGIIKAGKAVSDSEAGTIEAGEAVGTSEAVDTSASDKEAEAQKHPGQAEEILPEAEIASKKNEIDSEKIQELEDKLQVKTVELEEMSKRLEMLVSQMADTEETGSESTEELEKAVKRLEGFNSSLEADRQQLRADLDKVQADLKTERADKIRLSTDLQLERDRTKGLEGSIEELQGKQRETRERLEGANFEASEWRAFAEKAWADIADLLLELFECIHETETLRKELESLQAENDELQSQKAEAEKTLADAQATLAEKSELVEKLSLAISEKEREVSEMVTLKEKLEGQNEYSEVQRQQNQAEVDRLTGILNEKLSELDAVKTEMDKAKAEYTSEIERIGQELTSEKSEHSRLGVELQAKTAELEGLRTAYGILQDKLKNVQTLGESVDTVGQGFGQPNTDDGHKTNEQALEEEVNTLKAELSASEGRAETLQQEVSTLREKCEQLEQVHYSGVEQVSVGTSSRLECRYTGNCKIIPVFGSGSYGVTTMAMSLAMRNQAERILYMDFDLSSPKADGWFNVNPLNDRLTGIKTRILKSGVGIMSVLGAESLGYIRDNISNIIQTVSNKSQAHGRIDYFSGIYGTLDEDKLRQVDFTRLFEYLGNMYDYIYIDLGKLASSKIQSELTAMVCSIAHKVVVVTKNDKFDARNFSVKLMEYAIKTDGMVWVLNMVTRTAIDALTKKAIGTAEVVLIPFSQELLDGNVSFGRSYTLRSKLNEIADKIG